MMKQITDTYQIRTRDHPSQFLIYLQSAVQCWSGVSDLCKLYTQHATTVFTHSPSGFATSGFFNDAACLLFASTTEVLDTIYFYTLAPICAQNFDNL